MFAEDVGHVTHKQTWCIHINYMNSMNKTSFHFRSVWNVKSHSRCGCVIIDHVVQCIWYSEYNCFRLHNIQQSCHIHFSSDNRAIRRPLLMPDYSRLRWIKESKMIMINGRRYTLYNGNRLQLIDRHSLLILHSQNPVYDVLFSWEMGAASP